MGLNPRGIHTEGMRTVRDDNGREFLLLKESAEASLVRDLATGEERYLPNDRLDPSGEPPLVSAARAIPDEDHDDLARVPNDRALGLLVELWRRGAVPVRQLLGDYELCESDLHGVVGELSAAGLVRETHAAGERAYELTASARESLAGALDESG